MKSITLYTPYAGGIAYLLKRFETRSWRTHYRGPIAIHTGTAPIERVARKFTGRPFGLDHLERELRASFARWQSTPDGFPWLGKIVCVAKLSDCIPTENMEIDERERRWGDYTPGRFAWRMSGVELLYNPIPCTGHQGLWNVPADVEARINAQRRLP